MLDYDGVLSRSGKDGRSGELRLAFTVHHARPRSSDHPYLTAPSFASPASAPEGIERLGTKDHQLASDKSLLHGNTYWYILPDEGSDAVETSDS
jgi:hypothetical protein